jgi:hypothetical protein
MLLLQRSLDCMFTAAAAFAFNYFHRARKLRGDTMI